MAAARRVVLNTLVFALPIVLITDELPNGYAWGNVALLLLLTELGLVLHEAAHAGAALLLGFNVRRMVFGQGPLVFHRRVGGTDLVLRAIPFTGITFLVPKGRAWYRLRRWFVVAAAPALNLALGWWCLGDRAWFELAQAARTGLHPLDAFAAANAYLALTALLPIPTGLGVMSDGAVLLTLPFVRKPPTDPRVMHLVFDVEDAYEAADHERVRELCERGLSIGSEHDVAFRATLLQIDAEDENDKLEQAVESMRALLATLPPESPCRPLLQNNIAWYSLELERAELLPSALALSEQALTRLGSAPWAKGTQGALLVASGQIERGQRFLLSAFHHNESARARAHNAAWLAVATAHGSRERANRWLRLARELDPKSRSIRRAEIALSVGVT